MWADRGVPLVASSGLQKIANLSTSNSYVAIIGRRAKCGDVINTVFASKDKTFINMYCLFNGQFISTEFKKTTTYC